MECGIEPRWWPQVFGVVILLFCSHGLAGYREVLGGACTDQGSNSTDDIVHFACRQGLETKQLIVTDAYPAAMHLPPDAGRVDDGAMIVAKADGDKTEPFHLAMSQYQRDVYHVTSLKWR